MQTCRMCREIEDDDKDMVRFGPRHYAHWGCFFDKHGVGGWKMLNAHQVKRTPFWLIRNKPGLREAIQ